MTQNSFLEEKLKEFDEVFNVYLSQDKKNDARLIFGDSIKLFITELLHQFAEKIRLKEYYEEDDTDRGHNMAKKELDHKIAELLKGASSK